MLKALGLGLCNRAGMLGAVELGHCNRARGAQGTQISGYGALQKGKGYWERV